MLTSHTIFNNICEAAKKKDKATLQKIVDEQASIDIFHGIKTPAEFLAEQGECAAVDFLINYFGANMNYAARGFAYSGFDREVEKLNHLGAVPHFIIKGYAMAGNSEAVSRYNHAIYPLDELLKAEMWGYGYGCDVENIINLQHANFNHIRLIYSAYKGLAQGGHVDKIKYITDIDRSFTPKDLMKALARCGYDREVNKILDKNPHLNIEQVIRSYLKGGYEDKAIAISDYPISQLNIADYAYNGNYKKVNEILDYWELDKTQFYLLALKGYFSGGHIQVLNHFINSHSLNKSLLNSIALTFSLVLSYVLPGVAKCSGRFQNKKQLLHTLAFLKEDTKKIVLLASKYLNKDFINKLKIIMKQADQIRKLMNSLGLSYSQALLCQSKTNVIWLTEVAPMLIHRANMPLDMIKVISTYLMDIKENEIKDLQSALLFSQTKMLLLHHLTKPSLRFSSQHEKIKGFCSALENTNQASDLINLIEANLGQTPEGSDPKTPQLSKSIFAIFKKKKDFKQSTFYQRLDKANQRLKKLI